MMEDVIFKNRNLEVSRNGSGFIVVTYNAQLANELNGMLKGYYPVSIKKGEEPQFKLNLAQAIWMTYLHFFSSAARGTLFTLINPSTIPPQLKPIGDSI